MIDIIITATDVIISPVFALPINILSGMQNGDENGNIAANKLISLAEMHKAKRNPFSIQENN